MTLQTAVIGEGTLLLSCLGDLIESSFKIPAVFTDTSNAVSFCDARNIPVYSRRTGIEESLFGERPDYIFSINNPRILTPEEIRVSRCMAINYHDSLLPRYAGSNSTCWAIMNGETTHGVSWHVVEPEIDTGDVLGSEKVFIAADDSVFTLNMKCQEAAGRTFKILLQDILNDDLHPVPQDLSMRSYYGIHKLLPNMGILDFEISFDKIYNFVRALEYGHHDNLVGVAKIRTASGGYLLVQSAEQVSDLFDVVSPGTVLRVLNRAVIVATGTDPIKLNLAQLNGSPNLPKDFEELGLAPGRSIQSNVTISGDPNLELIRKKESFWRRKLQSYEPTTFFSQKMNVLANIMDTTGRLDVKNITICELEPNCDITYLYAAFLAFLARVCCVSEVNIGILANAGSVPSDIASLYANILPCQFQVQLTLEAKAAIMKLESDLKRHNLDKPCLRDVHHRYAIPIRSPYHNLVLGRGNCTIPEEVLHQCNMLLLFVSESNKLVAMYNKIRGQNYVYICNTIKHFSTFLSGLKSSVSLELSDISLISADEVKKWNTHNEEEKPSEGLTLIKGFEKWCTETPTRIAIKSTGLSLTYGKCLKYMTKLSRLICKRKFQETQTISIHMPNSIQYVLTVLAILKCGVTFLPIPTDYPPDRVKFILSDSNVREMLTLEELYVGSLLEAMPGSTVRFRANICGKAMVMISWDGIQGSGDQDIIQDESRKQCQASDEACYIIYTSGSTGRPKGVKIKQSSVFNMAEAQIKQWDLDASDVVAQFASIGFDASISEIFTSLLSGGTLAIPEKDQKHGHEFATAISTLGVTTITLPPSVLNIYSPSDLPTVRKLVSAGESCSLRIALKWSKATGIRVFNGYGPTETTVCATMYEYDAAIRTGEFNHELPIGRAIAGCYVYLFDDYMQPVPSGVVGQMYIGGRGLSAGYIGHAQDRNHESFVQNPLTNKTELLYRTGDHAVRDEDGVLTFVGRIDDQVKVRGHRIDLSEIEQVLIQHIMVQVAVVVVHKCSRSHQQALSAFISPDFVFLSELREYLAKVLPKYMIPTYIKKFTNEDFPMTVNGKVDRDALSRDETVHEQNINGGHSHLNETQLAVARLWCEVLQLDNSQAYSMYRTSSFSEMGGNSLHLVLLQRAIKTHLHVHLSFTDIGSSDTIDAFAQVIQKKRESATPISAVVRRRSSQLAGLVLSDTELDFNGGVRKLFDIDIGLKCSPPMYGKKVPMTILISGVTGFLGAYMLSELLENTVGNICCMVREATEVKGFGRVVENLRKYGLWKFEYSNRIAIVVSDLSQKNLGIAPDIYDALTNDVDAVFINAAMMDFNGSYEAHRQANVNSTREFIKFAVKNRRKYLFLTSSLSVFLFPVNPTDTIMMEADSLTDPTQIEGGYGLSKWASEKLVMKALSHLPGGAIFRPARISGNSSDGVGPTNDLFARTLNGMKKMGSYPDLIFPYDLTPVDFCAKAMIEIACKIRLGQGGGRTVFHLFNKSTIPFKDLFQGTELVALPLSDWREELRLVPEDNVELCPLTPFFMSRFWDRAHCWPVFDTSNTDSLISDATKKLLRPTGELLDIYKSFIARSATCSCL